MPLHKTPAVILKSRKWGEADRIVTLFSLRFGKLRGVARGARRQKSQFGAGLEPFVHADLDLFEKQGDSLYRITHVDIQESFLGLRENLEQMASASRLMNLVEAITVEGDPSPELFSLVVDALRALKDSQDPLLWVLLYQIRILGQSGFCPQTHHCAVCGTTSHRARSRFSPKAGGMICPPCMSRHSGYAYPMSPGSWAFLSQATHIDLAVLTRLKATGAIRQELEVAIESFVTVVAGKNLPAANFFSSGQFPSG